METQHKKHVWLLTVVGILVVILIGAIIWRSIKTKGEENKKLLYASIEEADPQMREAAVKARASIGDFITMLKDPGSTVSYFALKARFEEKGIIEHLWLNFVTFDGKEFEGNVANDPKALQTLTFGKTVRVPVERVSDWMVIDDGFLLGGYTLRVLRDRMSEPEKRAFDEKGGFKVEER
jgi:uncharacterized protein YegJ (DUF2314 family)